jgi:hypothetical protein
LLRPELGSNNETFLGLCLFCVAVVIDCRAVRYLLIDDARIARTFQQFVGVARRIRMNAKDVSKLKASSNYTRAG